MSEEREREVSDWKRPAAAAALLTVLSFFVLGFFHLRAPYLYDADSYLHLAVGVLYAEEGLVKGLPWPRFSVMHDAYGDKELLFHILLIPFASMEDPATGGRLALALFGALVAGAIGLLAMRRIGWWGFFVPWWIFFAAPPFLDRIIRLRPELLALLLLLAAMELMVRRRPVWLGVTAALFTLSYTAFHVLAGLVVIWVVLIRFSETRWEWRPLIATAAGTLAGLVVHPHPLDHLKIWWLQNVTFFRLKGTLDVGEEIFAPPWHQVVLVNGGWWLVIILLLVVALRDLASPRTPRGAGGPPAGSGAARPEALRDSTQPLSGLDLLSWREGIIYGSTAIVFTVLYLLMGRMILYAVPFVTLATLFLVARRPIARGVIVILGTLVALSVVTGIYYSARIDFLAHTVSGRVIASEGELERFGRAVPEGARIVARWQDAELYAFWAPQGRYINLYDPLFMAVPWPEQHRTLQRIFEGEEPDIPVAIARHLDSDHLAVQRPWSLPRLDALLRDDPRWQVVHAEANLLLRATPPGDGRFLVDWSVAPAPGGESRMATRYPRLEGAGAELEGFVELGRVTDEPGCRRFVARIDCDGCTLRHRVRGHARFLIDDEPIQQVRAPAVLSPWSDLEVETTAGSGIAVDLCGDRESGFHLYQQYPEGG
jgi:hypothetical protein